jgi:hypothetical protein
MPRIAGSEHPDGNFSHTHEVRSKIHKTADILPQLQFTFLLHSQTVLSTFQRAQFLF